MRFKIIIFNIIIFMLNPVLLISKDLGVWGQVYPIQEQDFLLFIKNKLANLNKNGQLELAKKKFITRSVKHVIRPNPVMGLSITNIPKTFYYDPSFILKHDIYDALGQVLYHKGKTINPLDIISFRQAWVFFDADDPNQVSWVQQKFGARLGSGLGSGLGAKFKSLGQVRLVLVKGDIAKTIKTLGVKVYFDQQGILSRKFKLKHIPVIISASGNSLKIQEFKINKFKINKFKINKL